ncbi:hypothetical protein LPC08_12680 [Roseomonas sp. OT10]|uniref:hypothetical protein n=1 Tax=Roseomonas cutis TaxID=2897332 RepID=UPI001E4B43FF|nr:hypothetical protein [Roseomonas sp. OT10]UFN46885.1 hypothetical protein LPC08_12680 [Roseomonas sp. OT10]
MSDTLDLLDEIVKGAESASGKGSGQPLRATEWNTLAGAVARLARLAASREKGEADALRKQFAPVDHQHLGQVGLTWLDAQTRQMVEGKGAAADVTAKLAAATKEVASLRDQVAALSGQVDRLRDALADAGDAQRVRDRRTDELSGKLDGVLDLDKRVSAFDNRLTGIGGQVEEALKFRDTLFDVTGAPIDVKGLNDRVAALGGQVDRLRTADGEVLRARDLESRLKALEEAKIDLSGIDTRVGSRLDALLADPDGTLATRAAEAAATRLEPRFATLEAGLGETRGTLATLDAARSAQAGRLDTLDSGLATQSSRADALAASLGVLNALPGRVAAVETGLAASQTRLTAVEAMRADVTRAIDLATGAAALSPRVAALETSATGLETRLKATETAVATLPDLRGKVDAATAATDRIDAIATQATRAENAAQAATTRVTAAESRLGTLETLPGRISVLESSTASLNTWRGGVDTRLSQVPTASTLADLNTRLAGVEARSAAQEVSINRLNTSAGGTVITRPISTRIGG